MSIGQKQGDPRVKTTLELMKSHYQLDNDGDYKVTVEFEDGRSQVAYICSETEFFDNFELREIWSISYISEGFLDIDTANYLLLENDKLQLGSWRLMELKNNSFAVVFAIQVAADSDINSFNSALYTVLKVADDMEKRFTGKDHL